MPAVNTMNNNNNNIYYDKTIINNNQQQQQPTWKDMADQFFRKLKRKGTTINNIITPPRHQQEQQKYEENNNNNISSSDLRIYKEPKLDVKDNNSKATNDLIKLQMQNDISERTIDHISYICSSLIIQKTEPFPSIATLSFYCPNRIKPSITLDAYVSRLIRGINKVHIENHATIATKDSLGFRAFLISSAIYLPRLKKLCPEFVLDELNVHRVLMIGMLIAVKILEDDHIGNTSMAKLGGVPTSELNLLETEYCKNMRFEFNVSNEELQAKYFTFGTAAAAA